MNAPRILRTGEPSYRMAPVTPGNVRPTVLTMLKPLGGIVSMSSRK